MRERRQRPRLPLHLSARIRPLGNGEAVEGETEDINCAGLSFRSHGSFALGDVLEVRLDFSDIFGSLQQFTALRCVGRVVQVEYSETKGKFRYGCQIEDYTIELAPSGLNHRNAYARTVAGTEWREA